MNVSRTPAQRAALTRKRNALKATASQEYYSERRKIEAAFMARIAPAEEHYSAYIKPFQIEAEAAERRLREAMDAYEPPPEIARLRSAARSEADRLYRALGSHQEFLTVRLAAQGKIA